jgi:hypothetical protein
MTNIAAADIGKIVKETLRNKRKHDQANPEKWRTENQKIASCRKQR